MADPITLKQIWGGAGTLPVYMSIALTDTAGGKAVSATTDNVTQTSVFNASQKEMFAACTKGVIDVNCNAVTGTPVVVLIAERTDDTSIASTTNWQEIGRASMTPAGASTLPCKASISIDGPFGYNTNFIRVRADSTGGTLSGSHKFTVNDVATATVPASAIKLTRG